MARYDELVYNFGLLNQTMSTFKDHKDLHDICYPLILTDDINSFKDLWEKIVPDKNSLMKTNYKQPDHAIMIIMTEETSKIRDYLLADYYQLYTETFLNYMKNGFAY